MTENDEREPIERTAANHIVWRNSQWVLFEDRFLSARQCGYHIPVEDLARGVGSNKSWHRHVGAKQWVDLADFNEAFAEAVRRFKLPITMDQMETWEDEAHELYGKDQRQPRYDHKDDAYYGHWA